jgi:D-alanyl-D-alanine carboxypeptidase
MAGSKVTMALAALLAASSATFAEAGPSIVVEYGSGRVVKEEEATRPWYPASLSKLMTAYVVFKAIENKRVDLGTPILISKRAARMAPSKMGYPAGTLVTIDDALKMLIVQSANDIAVALAENISGSVGAFAAEMNAYSRSLGMTQSHWVNPNGLPDPRQVSSARDMAILARALLSEFPEHSGLFQIHAIKSGKRVMRTHNSLIYRYPGADGMKTGFICAGGFNVVATATRRGHKLITVVLGSPSAKERTRKAAGLFEIGFKGGGLFSSSSTLAQLTPSPYGTPTDIREVACGKRRNVVADAEDGPAKPVTRNLKPEGVMATLMQAPAAAPDGPLLTSWTIAPPVPVGPYKGPRRPPQVALLDDAAPEEAAPQSVDEAFKAVQARAPAAQSAVSSYAEPAPARPMVLPSDPAASALPDQVPAAPPGAIRPGTASLSPGQPMPGQIPRSANPLENLASDPLAAGKPPQRTSEIDGDGAVPTPVPRPEELRPARSTPRKKAKGKRG